jgi:hypothetical protein
VALLAPRRCANVSSQLSELWLAGSSVVYDEEEVTSSGTSSHQGFENWVFKISAVVFCRDSLGSSRKRA